MSTLTALTDQSTKDFDGSHCQSMTQYPEIVCQNVTKNSPEHVLRAEDGKLLPGSSLNPLGRPKTAKLVSEALKEALASDNLADTLKTRLVSLTESADKDSVRLAAIAEIVDRTEGKAVQSVRMAGVFMVSAPSAEVLASLDNWGNDE